MPETHLIVESAPLRISLAGGGTDLPEYFKLPERVGQVCSLAIDKYVSVTLSSRFEDEICVAYRQLEFCKEIADIKHDMVRTFLDELDMPPSHLEAHIISDVPCRGTGLGASSALSVALLRACHKWIGREHLGWEATARLASRLERQATGAKVGLQDHAVAARGGANRFTFYDDGIKAEALCEDIRELDPLVERLLLFHLSDRGETSGKLLNDVANGMSRVSIRLDRMAAQAWAAARVIKERDWEKVGDILREGWEQKQMLADGIATAAVRNTYRCARQRGASGGKLCGAGGGGFMLFYVEPKWQEGVRGAMSDMGLREMRFRLAPFTE